MIQEEVNVMDDDKEKTRKDSDRKLPMPEAQEVKEILSVVSSEVPALLKGAGNRLFYRYKKIFFTIFAKGRI